MRLLLGFFLLTLPGLADLVVLKNGDRITGAVVKKEAKNLIFKSEAFGVVTIPWDKVAELAADKPLFVELSNDRTLLGTITTNQDHLEIETVHRTEDSPLAEVLAIRNNDEQVAYERLRRPSWANLWAGTATLGWAGARGNAKALTLTTGFNAARLTSTDKTTVQLNAIQATAVVDGVSAATAEAVRGGWAYSRTFATRFTWNGFNDYEYDRFQNLDLRFVLGGGLGLITWKGERGRLEFVSGGAYNREAFAATDLQPAFSRNASEAYLGDDFTFNLSSVTSFFQTSRTFANLNNRGDYRINMDVGANTKLTRWLSWNVSISDRYLSHPVPGRRKNDFLYTTGIGVSFAK